VVHGFDKNPRVAKHPPRGSWWCGLSLRRLGFDKLIDAGPACGRDLVEAMVAGASSRPRRAS
jgi:hypothetical protein